MSLTFLVLGAINEEESKTYSMKKRARQTISNGAGIGNQNAHHH